MSRVALVTGAEQGIGRTIALRLASDGFYIAVNDLTTNKDKVEAVVKEVHAHGQKSAAVYADVSQEDQVEGMVLETVAQLGSLDIMVANAGVCYISEILETPSEEFDRIIATNLRGTFLCYKYAGKQMVMQGRGGRIIGACSNSGKQGMAELGAYSASKFGIRGLTQCAAMELGKHNITVNAYAPGPTKTDFLDLSSFRFPGSMDDFYAELAKATSTKSITHTEDIAAAVSFFASKEAHQITGQTLNIDGGCIFD